MMLIQNNPALGIASNVQFLQFMALQHMQNMQAMGLLKLSTDQAQVLEALLSANQGAQMTNNSTIVQQQAMQMDLMRQMLSANQMPPAAVHPEVYSGNSAPWGTATDPQITASPVSVQQKQVSQPQTGPTSELMMSTPEVIPGTTRGPPPGLSPKSAESSISSSVRKGGKRSIPPGLAVKSKSEAHSRASSLSGMQQLGASASSLNSEGSGMRGPSSKSVASSGRRSQASASSSTRLSMLDDISDETNTFPSAYSDYNVTVEPTSQDRLSSFASSLDSFGSARNQVSDNWYEDVSWGIGTGPGIQQKLPRTGQQPKKGAVSSRGLTASTTQTKQSEQPNETPKRAVIDSSGMNQSNQPNRGVISSSGMTLNNQHSGQPKRGVISSSGMTPNNEPSGQPKRGVISSSGMTPNNQPSGQPKRGVISSSGMAPNNQPSGQPKRGVISSRGMTQSNQPKWAVITSGGMAQLDQLGGPGKASARPKTGSYAYTYNKAGEGWNGLGAQSEDWDEDGSDLYVGMFKWHQPTNSDHTVPTETKPVVKQTKKMVDFVPPLSQSGAKIPSAASRRAWSEAIASKPLTVIGGSVSIKPPLVSKIKKVKDAYTMNPILTGDVQPLMSLPVHKTLPNSITTGTHRHLTV